MYIRKNIKSTVVILLFSSGYIQMQAMDMIKKPFNFFTRSCVDSYITFRDLGKSTCNALGISYDPPSGPAPVQEDVQDDGEANIQDYLGKPVGVQANVDTKINYTFKDGRSLTFSLRDLQHSKVLKHAFSDSTCKHEHELLRGKKEMTEIGSNDHLAQAAKTLQSDFSDAQSFIFKDMNHKKVKVLITSLQLLDMPDAIDPYLNGLSFKKRLWLFLQADRLEIPKLLEATGNILLIKDNMEPLPQTSLEESMIFINRLNTDIKQRFERFADRPYDYSYYSFTSLLNTLPVDQLCLLVKARAEAWKHGKPYNIYKNEYALYKSLPAQLQHETLFNDLKGQWYKDNAYVAVGFSVVVGTMITALRLAGGLKN